MPEACSGLKMRELYLDAITSFQIYSPRWDESCTIFTRIPEAHPEKYHVNSAIKLGDYNVGRSGEFLPFRSTWHFFLQKYRFIRILLRDVSIPKLGATAPVLGIEKPSPIDDYTEYWV